MKSPSFREKKIVLNCLLQEGNLEWLKYYPWLIMFGRPPTNLFFSFEARHQLIGRLVYARFAHLAIATFAAGETRDPRILGSSKQTLRSLNPCFRRRATLSSFNFSYCFHSLYQGNIATIGPFAQRAECGTFS